MNYELHTISVQALLFDGQNPRFHDQQPSPDQLTIAQELHQLHNPRYLMEFMAKGLYLPAEPLPVVHKGELFTVVDGNHRLLAARILTDSYLSTNIDDVHVPEIDPETAAQLSQVTVAVFSDRQSLLPIQLRRNFTRYHGWDFLTRTLYLKKLTDNGYPLPPTSNYRPSAKCCLRWP